MIVTASEVSQLPALIGVQQACDLLGISRSAGYAPPPPATCRRSGSAGACTFDRTPFALIGLPLEAAG